MSLLMGITAVLLVFVAVLLVTGDLEYVFEETAVTVEADWFVNMTIRYENIDSVEYRDGNMPGSRVGGFGSFRLLMGAFRNEEFGGYTRYTYYDPDACVVLTVKGRTIVLSGENVEQTRNLFQELCTRTGK